MVLANLVSGLPPSEYIYLARSRRSRGLSLGINLTADQECNYQCIYCEVLRRKKMVVKDVDLAVLKRELQESLEWLEAQIKAQNPILGEKSDSLKDIAFAGDGEPTAYKDFASCVRLVRETIAPTVFAQVPIVLITNATYFHKPWMEEGLLALDEGKSEIWAKMDAGTQSNMNLVNGTTFPLVKLLDNIYRAGKKRSIAIQSCFMKIHGSPPAEDELRAYCDCLQALVRRCTKIHRVMIYTVARPPLKDFVKPLSLAEVDAIVEFVKKETDLVVEGYY